MKRMLISKLLNAALIAAGLGCGPAEAADAPAKVHKIGFISASASPAFLVALKEGLAESGYVEGKNMSLTLHAVDSSADLSAIAQQLVTARMDLIIAGGNNAVVAAKKATTTIPIVMTNCGHPVDGGIVQSMTKPGGNITGLSQNSPQLAPKRLDLLKTSFPKARKIGALHNPEHATAKLSLDELQAAASQLGLELVPLGAAKPEAIAEALAKAKTQKIDALMVLRDPFTVKHAKEIVEQVTAARLPAMYESRNYVDAGGLMLYGPSFADLYRRSAVFVDKVLKGQNPGTIPIEVPAQFEFVVNRKAADAIGVTIPQAVLVRADEVIE